MLLCADNIETQSFFSGAESMFNEKKKKRKKKVIKVFLFYIHWKNIDTYTHFLNIMNYNITYVFLYSY